MAVDLGAGVRDDAGSQVDRWLPLENLSLQVTFVSCVSLYLVARVLHSSVAGGASFKQMPTICPKNP